MRQMQKPNADFVDLSYNHKTSFDMGDLIPISCIPVMPGDKLDLSIDCFIRAMPTIFPIMEDVTIKFNHFYVPNRIVWDKWKEYQTLNQDHAFLGEVKPNVPQIEEALYPKPYVNSRLGDYLGYPSVPVGLDYKPNPLSTTYNAIPFLGYQHIYLEWYAPQRWLNYLQHNNSYGHYLMNLKKILNRIKTMNAPVLQGGGQAPFPQGDVNEITRIRKVGWNHDYFTSCLPEPQMINDVKIPLLSTIIDGQFFDSSHPQYGTSEDILSNVLEYNNQALLLENLGTINDLRKNIATQHFLEKINIGGGRYNETLKTIFGVEVPDRTLQRPEYLGGGVLQLFVNEVESTTENEYRELGEVGGKPTAGGRTNSVEFYAEEFGYVYTIMHVVPRRSYANAVDRHLKLGTIFDVMDLPNPEFQGLGDQAVYNWELDNSLLLSDKIKDDPNKVFGFAPRFAEWKYSKDRFSGEFKNSLKQWHMGDLVIQETEISPEFIEAKPRQDVFNVPSEPDKFFGTFRINCKGMRKLESQVLPGIDYI